MVRNYLIAAAGVLPVMGCNSTPKAANETPNIILMLVDDLGWRDVGFMGSTYFETPNLDRLAAKSMVFTSAYASCAVSSPTRSSVMTGKYPSRLGITDWIRARFQPDVAGAGEQGGYDENPGREFRTPANASQLELEEITIAEYLKTKGYFTCHLGKWHLGREEFYPEFQGYDLNIAGSDFGQPLNYFDPYRNKDGVGFPNFAPRKEGEYLTDRLADEVSAVIAGHKDKPFFISMCYYTVHTPLMAKEEMIEKYRQKTVTDGQKNPVYAAMVESLDQAAGKLIRSLEENKLMDNTVIVFMSDNGGLLGSTDNAPLRSGKGYPYEGGIRIPMFIYWSGVVNQGSTCSVPVSSIDFVPTICSIAGISHHNSDIDGRDLTPLLRGEKMEQVPLFWHFPHYRGKDVVPYSIIRDGDWKLIKRYEGRTFELFNLEADPSETTDLSDSEHKKVKELDSMLVKWLENTNARMPQKK